MRSAMYDETYVCFVISDKCCIMLSVIHVFGLSGPSSAILPMTAVPQMFPKISW